MSLITITDGLNRLINDPVKVNQILASLQNNNFNEIQLSLLDSLVNESWSEFPHTLRYFFITHRINENNYQNILSEEFIDFISDNITTHFDDIVIDIAFDFFGLFQTLIQSNYTFSNLIHFIEYFFGIKIFSDKLLKI